MYEYQVGSAKSHYENLSLSSACVSVLEIGNAGNMYMDERAPWSLFKKGEASAALAAKVIKPKKIENNSFLL